MLLRRIMPFYAVHKGRTPGIYKDWPSCNQQVMKFSGAVFKKFSTQEEANQFLNQSQKKRLLEIILGHVDECNAAHL